MASTLNTSKLHQALTHHADLSGKRLKIHHPKAVSWLEQAGVTPGNIRHHAARLATTGAIAGALLLANPLMTKVSSSSNKLAHAPVAKLHDLLAANIKALLPNVVRPLRPDEENAISKLITTIWGIKAGATLDGEHLNTSYGYIGAEQHLPRFPGDTVEAHDAYQVSGITPGKGAWGYFANSSDALTQDLIQKEKYYVAVQTLYLPDWQQRLSYLRDWYKYRKVVLVNPANGKTIVAVVADAGPANWTGKQFGGSPEVMAYLKLQDGAQKGAVVLFFVDDKGNEIPLGPVEYNRAEGQAPIAEK
ncbi:hypothetical protein A2Z00_04900 [Candidatus Gottesmanbacteria bacterium RBG_13_45_10]|uniref:Uncharacterized protein n=1 Tax=Candidatus Gottesmanbacteria bacterium RBG_13_45_10 TaxID=1798370 RepID=A0A1F5ZGC6_9BACT|nr:MAG: hypothetical protein A2Z00_04900 [Candidatus Gottesmanbacteria bacterium RBG_13_45_10]